MIDARAAIRIIALGALPLAATVHADVQARLTIASDYVHRGVLQSDDRPVYQALVDVTGESGLYAGVWLGRVDYPVDDRELEFDYFAGYAFRASAVLALDLGIVRYTYDHHAFGRDYDWSEVQVTAHVLDRWSLMAAAAEGWLGRDEPSFVVEGAYRHPLPWQLVTDATLGWQQADDVLDQRYYYGEIGLSRAFGPFDVRFALSGTEGAKLPADLGRTQWVVSFGWLPFAR